MAHVTSVVVMGVAVVTPPDLEKLLVEVYLKRDAESRDSLQAVLGEE